MTDAGKRKTKLEAELEELRQRVKIFEISERRRKQLEDSLHQAKEMFHSAFENAPVAMCLVAPQGRFLNVNAAFSRMLEYSKDELRSMSFGEVTHPDDLSASKEWVDNLLAGIEPAQDLDKRYIRKSGQVVWGIVRSFLLRDADGNPLFFITHVQDITERKRAERQIADSLAFIQKMFETSPVGIITYNASGDTVWTNEATARIVGGTVEQVKAQNFRELESWKRSGMLEAAEKALATGTEQQLDVHVTTSFGKKVWISSRFVPYIYEGQQHLLAIYSDITERMQMEEALFHSEKQFRNLLENVQLVAVMLDRDGNITYCNSYLLALTGWSAKEIPGKNWFDLFVPEEVRESVRSIFNEGIANSSLPTQYENEIRTRNGSRRLIVWNNSLLFDPQGDVTGTASIGNDVTDHRSLEEQLRQSQKMNAVGRLAGGIAHDFNNLLTVIIGYGELLLSKIGKDNPLTLEAGEIRKAALKAASLTSQLLAFSRRQILSPEMLNLNGIVTDVENMLRRIIEEHIHLALNLSDDLWMVKADRSRIEQVIINLVINAKDAMPKGGTLTIETRNIRIDDANATIYRDIGPGAYAVFSVRDTGHGMDRETMARIFEPFFTTKEVGKGTGLGLATVYGIVAQTGGHIHVDSEPDHGTTFSIYLPRAQGAPSPPKEAAGVEMATIPSGTKTILLVEDSGIVRKLTREVLEINGYAVLEAGSPEDAIRLCESHEGEIHLLLTDVVMPGMSGRDLSDRLQPVRPGMKVLYMSGYAENAIVEHGILDDSIHFIPKPFSPASMAQKIFAVLNSD